MRPAWFAAAACVVVAFATTSTASARPGPDLLYASPAQAPQFRNSGVWSAAPILVSGASSYRSGEYVYQDFLYDDHGAAGTIPDASDTRITSATFSRPAGTFTYPTNSAYANNAADLVEFRMKPVAGGTAFRVTYNTMRDPSLAAFTIALGGNASTSYAMPHGANTKAPGDVFITWHGATFDVVAASSGALIYSGLPGVDVSARQVSLVVPTSAYRTSGNSALRVAVATGLWNSTTNTYLTPSLVATPSTPGGAGTLAPHPSAFFNVGFRHNETAAGALNLPNFPLNEVASTQWRELGQSRALAAGDLTPFADVVDMNKLAAGINDDMTGRPQGVPTSGLITRILASHFEPSQGANYSNALEGYFNADAPVLTGNLQPYSLYVPQHHTAGTPYAMTVLLHALLNNYNQFANTNHQREFGERAPNGALVLTPEERGPGGWYFGLAEADVFEAWADVAQHYRLDASQTQIAGYSMGGYGAYKIATEYPDLFNRVASVVGGVYVGLGALTGAPTIQQPGTTMPPLFGSLRNVPVQAWYAAADELEPPTATITAQQALDALGYRYEYDLFASGDHLVFAEVDQYSKLAAFLVAPPIDANPAHVTYSAAPAIDTPQYGLVADHAYWLSSVRLRSASGVEPIGTIDVRSEGFGHGDAPVSATNTTLLNVLTGGYLGPMLYTSIGKTWGTAPATPAADMLHVDASNVASVTIDPQRAHVDCNATLTVRSDGPIAITLTTCGTQTFAATRASQDSPAHVAPTRSQR